MKAREEQEIKWKIAESNSDVEKVSFPSILLKVGLKYLLLGAFKEIN